MCCLQMHLAYPRNDILKDLNPMSDFQQLEKRFSESLQIGVEEDTYLSDMLSWLLVHELATNEKLYDQTRYDYIYEGLHSVLNYSRLKLHREILEFKACKSMSGPYDSYRELMTNESKTILLEGLNELLRGCPDDEFKQYLRGKVEAKV